MLPIVEPIDNAVRERCAATLATVLAELNSGGHFADPNFFPPVNAARYTRRLMWHDPLDRFIVVGMTWAPEQGAPLHDHNGLWGAEIVVRGTMRETSYDLIECDDEHGARFAYAGETVLPECAVATVVPPHEYHAYANHGTQPAHTVHVYAGRLDRCNSYTRAERDWWTRNERALDYELAVTLSGSSAPSITPGTR